MDNNLEKKIRNIIEEIRIIPLIECTREESENIFFKFRKLITKLRGFLNIVEDPMIEKLVIEINQMWYVETFQEAIDLKLELEKIFIYLEERTFKNKFEMQVNREESKKIMDLKEDVVELLYNEKAYALPKICLSLGLEDGNDSEAYNSKKSYIYTRIQHLNTKDMIELLKKILEKYPNSNLAEKFEKICDLDNLGAITGFEKIVDMIKAEIQKANYIIWIAIAWLTNRDLLLELWKKKNEGVDIQIIVNDDFINNNAFKEKLEKYFQTYKVNPNKCLMHNKFCIIDLEKVITGSYNWTNKAEYNKENIIILQSREKACEYAKEFQKLKLLAHQK